MYNEDSLDDKKEDEIRKIMEEFNQTHNIKKNNDRFHITKKSKNSNKPLKTCKLYCANGEFILLN